MYASLRTPYFDAPSRMTRGLRSLLLALLVVPLSARAQEVRPVVITGADATNLLGADVQAPVCFAYDGATWTQCPLQIDERTMMDVASAYPNSGAYADFYGAPPVLLYAKPTVDVPPEFQHPHLPFDDDPTVDGNDEIVTMARFFGQQADLNATAPPHVTYPLTEVEHEGAYVYLFVPSTPLDQSAGLRLVNFDFNLLAGNGQFPADYDYSDTAWTPKDTQPDADSLGSNPEYSVVTTDYYETSFEDRWIQRELRTTDGGAGLGPDLLDRVKYGSRPDMLGKFIGSCGRNEWTASAGGGTLGILKNGPIRAIRFAQGYNSGPLTSLTMFFYERLIVYQNDHRVHGTRGASLWFDYSPDAQGMTYYSNHFPGGVAIDGVDETSPTTSYHSGSSYYLTEYLEWDYLLGSQGSLVSTWASLSNFPDILPVGYYEDDATPDAAQCTGADLVAQAASGNLITQSLSETKGLPPTDPRDERVWDALEPGQEFPYVILKRNLVPGPPMSQTEAEALLAILQTETPPTTAQLTGGPLVDAAPPLLDGTLLDDAGGRRFEGTATDDRPGDTGIATITLSGATNLTLAVDPFTAGDASVGFTATPVDAGAAASGYVRADDVEGNADSLFVEIAPPAPDTAAPVLTAAPDGRTYAGTATDDGVDDTGIATIALSGATNLALTVDPFTAGDTSVGFTVTTPDPSVAASGYVRAEDVAGNADSLLVSIDPDAAAPLVAGSLAGQTFSGTATDDRAADTGIAAVALSGATNLQLSVDPFAAGDASVGFTATPIDPGVTASGYVRADDVAGNADSLLVEIAPPPPDTAAPIVTGSLAGQNFTGTATDDRSNDTGVAAVTLSGATNLTLTVDPFTAGDASVGYTVTRIDTGTPGSGYVRAEDVAGNADSLFVEIDVLFQYDLAAEATYAYTTATDGTITVTARNIGTDPMTNVRVILEGTSGVSVTPDRVSLGQIDPGASKDAAFSFTGASTGASAAFQVQDLVVRHGEGDSSNNDVTVDLVASDTAAPLLAGSVVDDAGGRRFEGTATDDRPGDTGIATITLSGATNLTLAVDPFTAGDAAVGFTATPVDAGAAASGYVRADDVEGNADSLFVEVLPPAPDTAAPVVDGTLAGQTFTGSATDDRPDDTGLAAVFLSGATNLQIAIDPFTAGDAAVGFTVTPVDAGVAASGYVRADDVAGNADSLFVDIPLPPPDTEAPVVAGTYGPRSFSGTATDDGPDDTGIASVVLGPDAVNLQLTVDPFTAGAASVSFTVEPIALRDPASGTVIATDVAGNEGSLFIDSGQSGARSPGATPEGASPTDATSTTGAAATTDASGSEGAASDDRSTDASTQEAGSSNERLEGDTPDASKALDERSDAERGPRKLDDASEDAPSDEEASQKPTRDRGEDARKLEADEEASAEHGDATGAAAHGTPATSLAAGPPRLAPNPSSGPVTLYLTLAEASQVEARVYDALGRQRATAFDGTLAAGAHTLPLRLDTLRSGTYLLRLRVDGRVHTLRFTRL